MLELAPTFAAFFLGGFVSLVSIINPPAALPFFTALTGHLSERDGQRLAGRASLYAFGILTASLLAGGFVMNVFGISYPALRIAGGIVVALLGHGMLFGTPTVADGNAERHRNPAFFPLALPGISGPGSIAVVIGISTEIRELKLASAALVAYGATILAIVATCLLTWLVLRSARPITARLGANGIEVMTRLVGFLLICIGVQFIASGIRTFVTGG